MNSDLEIASRVVSNALHRLEVEPREIYRYIAVLAHAKTDGHLPLVFWRKWGRTSGLFPTGAGGALLECSTREANDKHAVFVEGHNPQVNDTHDYLLYGVGTARDSGARSIGLVTSRRHYIDRHIQEMGIALDWVLISDRLEDHQRRFDLLGGVGKFESFPFARQSGVYSPVAFHSPPILHVRRA